MALYKTAITGFKEVSDRTLEASFKRPDSFSFKAGQHIQLAVPELAYPDVKGASRVLSISSSPLDKENISVAFRDTGSGFKRTLKEMSIGSLVKIEGPHGFFILPKESAHPIVFVAGGIGITPYISMIRFASAHGFGLPITLLYANRNKEGATYLEELQDIASKNKNFVFKNKFGRLDEEFIKNSVKDVLDSTWYIAGPPAMVDSVRNTLYLLGVDEELVRFEGFDGY